MERLEKFTGGKKFLMIIHNC